MVGPKLQRERKTGRKREEKEERERGKKKKRSETKAFKQLLIIYAGIPVFGCWAL